MNSFNHAALGCVAEWLHEDLAGLAPGAPGYRTMLVRARPAGGIDRAQATHESPYGHHAVAWVADGRRLEITLDVPPNTFADVVLPGDLRSCWVDGSRARPNARRRLMLSWGRHVIEAELVP